MKIIELFIAAWIPVLKMLIVTGVGSFIALPSIGVLTEEARKNINAVVYFVLNPSLVTNNLSSTFTLKSVASTWFMPINILLTFIIGSAFGWIFNKISNVPSNLRGLIIGCCASGNLGVMLHIVIPATCKESGRPFGNPDSCTSQALAYASLSMGIGDMIFWSYVYNAVRLSMGFEEEKMKIIQQESSSPMSIEEGTTTTRENDSVWFDTKDSFSTNGEIIQETSGTNFSEPSTNSKVQSLMKMTKSLSERPAVIALRRLFTPSIFGAIIGLTFGVVSPFRRALVGENAPLRSLQGALSLLGDGAVPATTLIMGGNLVKGMSKTTSPLSNIKISAIVGVVIVRFLLLPLTGVCIIKGAIHFGILHPDPLYHFVLLVQYALPPAMNMGVIYQLFGVGESECSVIFFWAYALTLLLFPLWSAFFMWLAI
ncbi:protein PIN-LIKES 3-like [Phalaenopsis equestris]|uniref:protein PIN-LIKES 3-like n=1 Tax=Phalaenopsis equestris TaxID=78828 RepID=UPI0009E2DB05|nr:protein PIN-LIKES 3-like [Phalaenopsis equestris]